MIQRIHAVVVVALALTIFANHGRAENASSSAAFTLMRGANPDHFVMDASTGPVGFALAGNDRLIACQFLPGQSPYDDKVPRTKGFVLFDLKTGREIQRTPFQMNFAGSFWACSSNGRYLVLGARAKTFLLDMEKGSVVRNFPTKEAFGVPAISPDNSTLALTDGRTLSLFDLDSGKLIRRLPSHPARIGAISFDEGGKGILSSCTEVTRRWDLASNTSKNFSVDERFRRLAFDPGGSKLFGTHQASDTSGGASCFDVRSGRRLSHVKNHFTMATDFANDRWYTFNTGRTDLVDAVQVQQLSQSGTPKYLPFDAKMKQVTSQREFFSSSDLRLSPDQRYLLLRIRGGYCSQVWRLDSVTSQSYLTSAAQLQHKYVPGTLKVVNKTREQLFLDEIWSIREKVWDLCEVGKKDQAIKEIETLLAAGERRLQKAPRRHQRLITNCAQAYMSLNQEQCLALNLKAMQMAEAGNRLDSDWELVVGDAASALSSLGRREEAAKMYQRIIDHRESKGLPIKASDYSRLASHQFDFKNPKGSTEAIKLFCQAWVQSKAQYGTLHTNTRLAYDTLVERVQMSGGWETLESVLVEQLKEYELYKGPGHPETAQAAQQLAQLYERLEKPDQALKTMDRSQRVLRDHVARALPSMSEDEQRTFLERSFQPAFDAAMEMAVRLKGHPEAAELSAGWILNAKGTATRALAERARIAASTKDPKVQAIAKELEEVRESLSSLSLAAVGSPNPSGNSVIVQAETRAKQIQQLRQLESELSWKLGLAGWTELRQDPWTSLSEVREKIPNDSVLIELTITGLSEKYKSEEGPDPGRESEIGPQNEAPRVVMWIIPPADRGSVRMAVVSERLMDLVRPLAGFHACVSGQVDPTEAAALARHSLSAIAQQLVRPLPPDVRHAKRWLISPDHLLWMIPWSALPESQGRMVVHRHQVQYLLSGRDLLVTPTAESQSVPMIVANPDYGSDPTGGEAFSPLPGTAKEAQGVYPYLKSLAEAPPEVHVGARAVESVVKAAQRPKVALFSTHGFASIRPDQHPMATCGLALTDANAAIRGEGDGVLTGLEILASDYRGTNLVVLSACQTALGNISSGEGVASLRYAFRLAGAKNVAATLWSIPDEITAEMMKDFFKHYSAGRSPSAALRLAQLATIHRLERDGNQANPALWAAFTIAGPPDLDDQNSGLHQPWRSANGKFTILAEFVTADESRVVLRKLDGAQIQVPLDELHPDDQSRAREAM